MCVWILLHVCLPMRCKVSLEQTTQKSIIKQVPPDVSTGYQSFYLVRMLWRCSFRKEGEVWEWEFRLLRNFSHACWHSRCQMGLHACQAAKLWERQSKDRQVSIPLSTKPFVCPFLSSWFSSKSPCHFSQLIVKQFYSNVKLRSKQGLSDSFVFGSYEAWQLT